MLSFLKNFSKIKPSLIAKEKNVDYSNIIKGTSSNYNINEITKEVKKKLLVCFLLENLSEEEKNAFYCLKKEFKTLIDENQDLYIIDQNTINDIYIIIKIFMEFIENE